MANNNLILIGAGGHCKACIDVIEQEGKFKIVGILDKEELVGTAVSGYEIIGTDHQLMSLIKNYCFLITVGQIKSATIRKRLFSHLKNLGASIATIISPLSYISKNAEIGRGSIIMHGVHVNASSKSGENNILNTGCIIEHDVEIGNHCHISTQAVINGDCKIGNEVFIGSNATISSQVQIGDKIVIGSGAVIHKSLQISGTYIGNPGRKLIR